ncbi:inner membrane complex protein 1m [Plasmodium brasilianum]|uniref:Inner membrane complex protein 1m, putative n=2 Tax=Plasmodium (Plasmodium) TaxID=418103 RepID=A0A1D3RIU8_PLAMA|nr:inner membrane complex protein 1m, putative [Plasmodium malariae]KAI4837929.1 inner membrane complex protein 1m [Plasmodium brasilianum]SCN45100.1 inner membrane complex protein 1m, putative [Plasmodium malariae]
MCENICKNKNKYVHGLGPMFMPQRGNDSLCTTMEDYHVFEPGAKPFIKNIIQETTINVPKIEYKEKIVQVPRVEYRPYPVVKEVETPVYQDRYKYKNVQVPQKKLRVKPVYKVIDVPQYKYVDKFVKKKYKRFKYIPKEVQIPFRPRREIYSEVPIPRYIPQYIHNSIRPETFNTDYDGQIPLFEGYNDCFLNMMNPFSVYNRKEKNKCILNCLCNGNNDDKMYEMDPVLFTPTPYTFNNNSINDMGNNFDLHPSYYDMVSHSYPFVVHTKENDFFTKIIDATSSALAAAGIAIMLAGKLSMQGISLFLGNNNQKSQQNECTCEHGGGRSTERQQIKNEGGGKGEKSEKNDKK